MTSTSISKIACDSGIGKIVCDSGIGKIACDSSIGKIACDSTNARLDGVKCFAALGPTQVGPVTVYPGLIPREACHQEAGWNYLKVHADQIDAEGLPTKEHAKWMLAGLLSGERYTVAKPVYSVWRNCCLGPVEARLRIYVPTYIEGVCRTPKAMRALHSLRAASTGVGSEPLDELTLTREFADPETEMGYIPVLVALLENKLHDIIQATAASAGVQPLLPRELPPDLSLFGSREELPNLAGGAVVSYRKNFLGNMADRYLQLFLPGGRAQIPWKRGTIIRFDRECKEGHDTAHFGDAGTSYKYAGRDHTPLGWEADTSGALLELLEIVRFVTNMPINFCLMNYYELGDSIGAHSDDEGDLVPDVGIFSVSLGYPRLFEMKAKSDAVRGAPLALRLRHGSALWMKGRTQKTHKHWIDAEKGKPLAGTVSLARVNLTFRAVRIRT